MVAAAVRLSTEVSVRRDDLRGFSRAVRSTGLTEVTLRLVPSPQLSLVHLHKFADRKVDVGDNAAKIPIPTAIMS